MRVKFYNTAPELARDIHALKPGETLVYWRNPAGSRPVGYLHDLVTGLLNRGEIQHFQRRAKDAPAYFEWVIRKPKT